MSNILGHVTLDMTLRIYQHAGSECERIVSTKTDEMILA